MPKKPVLMDTMIAGAAVTAHRFVKATAADNVCIHATANAAIEGVSDDDAAYTTGDVDVPVIRLGRAELELGDTVTRGTHAWLKSDATGRGVPIGAGTIQNVGAIPLQSGVVGDIIDVIVVTFASYPQANAADVLAEIADPGAAGAIPVDASGHVDIVTVGVETRTIAAPSELGQQLLVSLKTDGGNCTITVATLINQAGNNTILLDDAGDAILLIAKASGANKRWSVVVNDGCTLSTV